MNPDEAVQRCGQKPGFLAQNASHGCFQVRLPGTCGELVQGTLDGTPFLVSCPIDLYATVGVTLGEGPGPVVAPRNVPKARAALAATLAAQGQEGRGARLQVTSPLIRSKGLGSSTADVGGAILAAAAALGRELSPEELGRLAVGVEPSDSTLFPGLALFDHRGATLYEPLGPAPALDILVLDCGGTVDTQAYNRRDHSEPLRQLAPRHREALEALRAGLRTGDLELVGHAATLSAQAHQTILYKPALDATLALARQVGAVGVNVGHSGTVIGILLDPRRSDTGAVAGFVKKRLEQVVLLFVTRLVNGGAAGVRCQTSNVKR